MRKALAASLAAGTLLLIAASPAPASTTIRGQVKGAKGFTLNGTAANGRTVAKRLGAAGRFTLRFKGSAGRGATLHLIRANGRYYGPVVLARKGREAFLALSGRSAKLGQIRLRGAYATPRKAISKRAIGRKSVRADKRGKPIGAGRLGLVSRSTKMSVHASASEGADPDQDGLPSAYDADDDGDLLLDSVDQPSGPSSAGLFSTLFVGFAEALNANAGATAARIDPLLSGENRFNLVFFFDGNAAGSGATAAHVDCFALAYCRQGTGTAILSGVSESGAALPRGSRWVTYDPDGSGLPNLERIDNFNGRGRVFVASVQPRATSSQILPGDTYNVVFATGGADVTVPVTLASYFVTTPALQSHSSGGPVTTLTYPIAQGTPGNGTGNPIQLQSERLTLTFWRPQRLSIPGADTGTFADIGNLHYGVTPGGLPREVTCAGLYSALSSTLREESSTGLSPDQGAKLFPLVDSAPDGRPNPARTLSFTVDVGNCLRRAGIAPAGRTVELTLTAASEPRPGGQDRAAQSIAVRLP